MNQSAQLEYAAQQQYDHPVARFAFCFLYRAYLVYDYIAFAYAAVISRGGHFQQLAGGILRYVFPGLSIYAYALCCHGIGAR